MNISIINDEEKAEPPPEPQPLNSLKGHLPKTKIGMKDPEITYPKVEKGSRGRLSELC